MSECVYCNSTDIQARTIFRDNLVMAFPTNIPIVPGHTIIAPVRHLKKFEDLTRKEIDALFKLAVRVKWALTELFDAEGFHQAFNEGEIAGQSVPHFHIHIVPRKGGDAGITDYDPRRFLYRPGFRRTTPERELQDIAKNIGARLKEFG